MKIKLNVKELLRLCGKVEQINRETNDIMERARLYSQLKIEVDTSQLGINAIPVEELRKRIEKLPEKKQQHFDLIMGDIETNTVIKISKQELEDLLIGNEKKNTNKEP